MAATAHPEIQVYASLPSTVAPGADLNLDPNNWHWAHCLTFPLETFNALEFSRSYKWIRYAIGIVVGAEGDLSSSSDSLNVVDYNAGLPAESATVYYHTSDAERQRMYPLDPKIARTHVTSSVATTRRSEFRSEVAERDGDRCLFTGVQHVFCEAVHLLTHSKGDTYISAYTQHRSRDPTGGDHVQEIDSVCNGLFLNKYTHVGLGTHIAFLPTPNFAIDTADVDPTAPPGEKSLSRRPWCTPFRYGTPLRISGTDDWHPAILFDDVYAGAVMHHFGTQALDHEVTMTWMESFYPGGVTDQAHAEQNSITDKDAFAAEGARKHMQERQARHDARENARRVPDTFDRLMALPYILVPREELQTMFSEAREKAEAAEQRHVQEKVDTWNRQVTAS